MKRLIIILFTVMFAGANLYSQARLRIMESMVMPSKILNQEVRFSVCLPQEYYESNQRFPVVYLLHGLGDDETSWLEYGEISRYADEATSGKEIVPMIFIMPQGFRTYYVNDYKGTFRYQDMFIRELVPYIDSMFRTVPKADQRAVLGYSMGGFGALMLPLKHPDIFEISVPLSISVRTDEQYKSEDSKGWDDQWGRLFGEPGFTDKSRITDYYRSNSPFHFLVDNPGGPFLKLRIYIDNGDKEQTLCRSNEELHILMRNRSIPHEYRVRNGGHSFDYWCAALPNALRFMSDGFEGKTYRGDLKKDFKTKKTKKTEKIVKAGGKIEGGGLDNIKIGTKDLMNGQLRVLDVGGDEASVFVPEEYERTDRFYPVLYFTGSLKEKDLKEIATGVNREINEYKVCPMILVFLPGKDTAAISSMVAQVENQVRIRKGYRFRAIAGYGNSAETVFSMAISTGQFGTCILSDGFLTKEASSGLLQNATKESLKRTSIFIDSPDKGGYYEGNGEVHMILRDKDIPHEYRVREGQGGSGWMMGGMEEIIKLTAQRFHK